jgi:hypothetical protein
MFELNYIIQHFFNIYVFCLLNFHHKWIWTISYIYYLAHAQLNNCLAYVLFEAIKGSLDNGYDDNFKNGSSKKILKIDFFYKYVLLFIEWWWLKFHTI